MEIKNLYVKFSDNIIYDSFNLSLDNDKITCMLGPSGVGKTTLLNAIAKSIKYQGDINGVGKIGYIFQEPRLIDALTVKQNLEFVMNEKDDKKIDEVLKDLDMYEYKDRYPITLSGGQASRVSLARAIVSNPRYILMDEPFKDLDVVLTKSLIDLFRNLIEKNKIGALYITHNVDEALSIADRIIVLSSKPVQINLDIQINSDHKNLASSELNDAREKIYNALHI